MRRTRWSLVRADYRGGPCRMRFYANVWRAAVVVATAVALAAGLWTVGVTVVVLVTLLVASGAAFGWSWLDDPVERRRGTARGALWGGCSGAMIGGLPSLMGSWSLLVMMSLGLTAPVVVSAAGRALAARRPHPDRVAVEGLSDRDLERRWRHTTRRVRARGLTPATIATLVQERERLLDELERRDPDRFAAWLVLAA